MPPVITIWVVSIVVVLGLLLGYIRYELRDGEEVSPPSSETEELPVGDFFTYESLKGYSFSYPKTYVVVENPIEKSGSEDSPLIESLVIMTRDDYRDLEESDVPREGPIAITVEVFKNEKKLSLGAWVETQPGSNFSGTGADYKSTTLAGEPAIVYAWSGLYEGESVAVSYGDNIYIFSVTWMSKLDKILSDFRGLLATVRFK